jgi:cytoskeletal protein RodZ
MGYREAALVNLFSSHLANPEYKSPLVTMGILIAVAMFVVPAVIGLPFMASFIAAISARRKKSTEMTAEANDGVTASFTRTPPSEEEESPPTDSDTKTTSGGTG